MACIFLPKRCPVLRRKSLLATPYTEFPTYYGALPIIPALAALHTKGNMKQIMQLLTRINIELSDGRSILVLFLEVMALRLNS